jgi:hypothetical protein
MNTELVDKIVNAVLYEGYILYPYRRCVKNHTRWTFGCLAPNNQPMQTQFLVEGNRQTGLEVEVRFLQLTDRQIARVRNSPVRPADESNLEFVDALKIDGRIYQSWQEAVERRLPMTSISLDELLHHSQTLQFHFTASKEIEYLPASDAEITAALVRRQESLDITVKLSAEAVAGDELFRITVQILNCSGSSEAASAAESDCALSSQTSTLQSLASTHTILSVSAGQFVSLIDPPPPWQALTQTLRNEGTWPVLIGESGERNMLLSSPITLYDYPQVAAESPGDLFDATEIDEILSLRIMTMTDDECQQAAALDPRVRDLLVRTNSLSDQQLGNLHGTMRGLRLVTANE